jgi:hypothetical protein
MQRCAPQFALIIVGVFWINKVNLKKLALIAGCGLLGWWAWRALSPDRADKIAASETRMWQAYYRKDAVALGVELSALLQGQFGLSMNDAIDVSRDLGGAAFAFHSSTGNHDQVVLPALLRAYQRLRASSGRSFDADAAARAELAWWVARRTPGEDSPERVGERIAELYAIVYGAPRPEFVQAGLLRAQAARLRDNGGESSDWDEVERLLRRSYDILLRAAPE